MLVSRKLLRGSGGRDVTLLLQRCELRGGEGMNEEQSPGFHASCVLDGDPFLKPLALGSTAAFPCQGVTRHHYILSV